MLMVQTCTILGLFQSLIVWELMIIIKGEIKLDADSILPSIFLPQEVLVNCSIHNFISLAIPVHNCFHLATHSSYCCLLKQAMKQSGIKLFLYAMRSYHIINRSAHTSNRSAPGSAWTKRTIAAATVTTSATSFSNVHCLGFDIRNKKKPAFILCSAM